MKIKDLKPNEKNPRKISAEDKENLKRALHEFGDLGSIIYNRTSKRLVGGHQRASVIPDNSKIVIEQTHKTPTRTGTVAEGHIVLDGERFNYREVEWDSKREAAAMIAANKHGGEWDTDLLKLNFAEIPIEDLALTGFDETELKDLGVDLELPPLEDDEVEEIDNGVDEKGNAEEDSDSEEETDEQYVKNQKKTTENVPQEKIPSTDNVTPYEKTEEVKGIVNKKIMLIIECPNQEIKDSLKEKLQPEITQAGCKIF